MLKDKTEVGLVILAAVVVILAFGFVMHAADIVVYMLSHGG